MIQVKVDREILEIIKGKPALGSVQIGDLVRLDNILQWWESEDGSAIFEALGEGADFYDRQFTEWLKESRPEIFI